MRRKKKKLDYINQGTISKLFSYVVDHDLGFAPNPYGGYCTLAHCKFKQKRRNIIELADIGHWVVGTGGLGSASAGHGKLIYGMRVEDKMTLRDYARDERFGCRDDNLAEYGDCTNRFVLISQHYYYFGREAIDISSMPMTHLDHPFEKRGPRYRSDFSDAFIADFENWLGANYPMGMNGLPCGVSPSHALALGSVDDCTSTSGLRLERIPAIAQSSSVAPADHLTLCSA